MKKKPELIESNYEEVDLDPSSNLTYILSMMIGGRKASKLMNHKVKMLQNLSETFSLFKIDLLSMEEYISIICNIID